MPYYAETILYLRDGAQIIYLVPSFLSPFPSAFTSSAINFCFSSSAVDVAIIGFLTLAVQIALQKAEVGRARMPLLNSARLLALPPRH